MDLVNPLRSLVIFISGILLALPVTVSGQERAPSSGAGETTESSIDDIRVISPVTQSNVDSVLAGLRERVSLRQLTAAESNALASAVPAGTYFYAYGFQLEHSGEPSDFIVSGHRGARWRQFELHKRADGEVILLGYATQEDVGKFEYYSKQYGPAPNLLPQPGGDFNVLMMLPLNLIGAMTREDIRIGSAEATVLDAALLPRK